MQPGTVLFERTIQVLPSSERNIGVLSEPAKNTVPGVETRELAPTTEAIPRRTAPAIVPGGEAEAVTTEAIPRRTAPAIVPGGEAEAVTTEAIPRRTAPAIVPGGEAEEESGNEPVVVTRSPETEYLFSADDAKSTGLIIIESSPADAPGDSLPNESYVWWNWSGSAAIPDGSTSWVTITCNTPSPAPPAGSQVTKVVVHHKVIHPYIGDLECEVYNDSGSAWRLRDNEGSSTDNFDETKTQYNAFDGDNPTQKWYYRIRDTQAGDTGTLTIMQLYVYYETASQPDLQPYQGSGWDDKIVLSTVTGTTTSASTIYADDTIYVDYACQNSGGGNAGHFRYGLYIDGTLVKYVERSSLDAGYYSYVLDSPNGPLTAGSHIFKIVCDYNFEVSESSESNNTYQRTKSIAEYAPLPDLQPYQRSGWDDKIVLSTVTGTTTSATTIYDDETIYVDYACVNNGGGNAGHFRYGLYIDSTLVKYADVTSLDAGWYNYVLDSVNGPLTAGSHTFKIVCDYNNEVSESSETNNTYQRTKGFVERPQLPDLEPYQRSGWDDKIVLSTVTGTTTTASTIYDDETIYVDYACVNNGGGNAGHFRYGLYIDSTLVKYADVTSLDAGWYNYVLDSVNGPLTAGSHTFKIVCDYNNEVSESSETNNTYQRTKGFVERPQLPDLEPYQRSGWDDKIVLSTVTGTTTTASTIYDDETIYVDYACVNNGGGNAGHFRYGLYIDSTLVKYADVTSLDAGWYNYVLDSVNGPLTAGSHTFKIVCDYNNEVSESSETNNTYQRTKGFVERPQLPDLEPYQRSGWDDKIVLSTVTGTTTTASTIYDDETIYVDFACINNGGGNAGHFRVGLYIDGTRVAYTDVSSLLPGYYSYVLDAPMGPLAAGSHTFKVVCDYDNEVSESNESNNSYERAKNVDERVHLPHIRIEPTTLNFNESPSSASITPELAPVKFDAVANDGSISVTIEGGALNIIPAGDNVTLSMEGYDTYMSPGDPMIPVRLMRIALPPDADLDSVAISYSVLASSVLDGAYSVAPAPPMAAWDGTRTIIDWGEGKDIVDGYNLNVYSLDAFFVAEAVVPASYSQMRKWKMAQFSFYPVQYNPVTGKLRGIDRVKIDITYDFGTGTQDASLADDGMEDVAAALIDNYAQAKPWYSYSGGPVASANYDYVIVTTNNIFNNATRLDSFETFKENQGYNVLTVTESGFYTSVGGSSSGMGWGGGAGDTAAENIRSWLRSNYLSLGIEYVLFIGDPSPDSGDVPMKMCWPRKGASTDPEHDRAPTDYYYADLTGNWDLDGDGSYGEYNGDFGSGGIDTNVEIYVGRIPVYNSSISDLDGILQKTINYGTESGDLSWRQKVLLPMEPSDSLTNGWPLAKASAITRFRRVGIPIVFTMRITVRAPR